MTRKGSILYWCIAPLLFLLSWYIGHRLYEEFLQNSAGYAQVKDRSLVFASLFTGLYAAAWFVIRDLYPKK